MVTGAGALERLEGEGRAVAVLGDGDPLAAVRALRNARRTVAVIRTNAVLAITTAVSALPIAAGGAMGPTAAAAVVAATSGVVLANALRVHRIGPTGG
jgi:cation transport ATPase